MAPERSVRRVLMSGDTVGGVWTYSLDLARELTGRGITVTLATMGPAPSSDQRREASQISGLRVHHRDLALEWMDHPWDDVARAGDWLLELAARERPDVVHLGSYAHGALEVGAPVVVVGHSCVLSWWEAVKHEPAPPAWARYQDAVQRGIAGADKVVAPTRAMLAALHRHYGPLAQDRCQVIANGRRRFGGPVTGGKQPVIFAAGRLWDEAKNLALLDAIAPRLKWPVRIAGEPCAPSGRSLSIHVAVALGHLSAAEMAQEYARASIYVLPARYEPFGLSALEAALAGCALVLGDIASLREVWDEAAAFVPPDDPGELAHTLGQLIRDDRRRTVLAASAQRRARDLTPARTATAYLDLYQRLVAGDR